jgi:hypothetical protein
MLIQLTIVLMSHSEAAIDGLSYDLKAVVDRTTLQQRARHCVQKYRTFAFKIDVKST